MAAIGLSSYDFGIKWSTITFVGGSFHVKYGIKSLSSLNEYNFCFIHSMIIKDSFFDYLGINRFFSNNSIFEKTFHFRMFWVQMGMYPQKYMST